MTVNIGDSMLKKLRGKKIQKKIWIVLAVLVLPAFVLWGTGNIARNKQGSSVTTGIILGKKISSSEYNEAIIAVRTQAIMRFGEKFSEIQKYLNWDSQAWDRLTLLAEAKKRKITISDKEIIESIANYPFFQSNGRFDDKIYSQMIKYVFHTSPRIFEEQTRQNLAISKLYEKTTEGITVNEAEIEKEYRDVNEQISLFYILSSPEDFVKDITISEGETRDYFEKNSIDFKKPRSFNIEYISILSETKENQTVIDNLNKAFSRLNKKEDFNKIAAELGATIKETGLFEENGPITGIGWVPQIIDSVIKAKIGEYLPPIYIDKSYYILKIKDKKEPYIPDIETIKDKIKEKIIQNKAKEIAKEKIEKCLNILKEQYANNPESLDFDKIAKSLGLKSNSTNMFKYNSYIEGIGSSDKFWTSAQELKEKDISEIIEMPTGFYITKLKSKMPVDEKKFQEEKKGFTQKLLEEKKQEHFEKILKELKNKTQRF